MNKMKEKKLESNLEGKWNEKLRPVQSETEKMKKQTNKRFLHTNTRTHSFCVIFLKASQNKARDRVLKMRVRPAFN